MVMPPTVFFCVVSGSPGVFLSPLRNVYERIDIFAFLERLATSLRAPSRSPAPPPPPPPPSFPPDVPLQNETSSRL